MKYNTKDFKLSFANLNLYETLNYIELESVEEMFNGDDDFQDNYPYDYSYDEYIYEFTDQLEELTITYVPSNTIKSKSKNIKEIEDMKDNDAFLSQIKDDGLRYFIYSVISSYHSLISLSLSGELNKDIKEEVKKLKVLYENSIKYCLKTEMNIREEDKIKELINNISNSIGSKVNEFIKKNCE